MHYQIGKRKLELKELILLNELPLEFKAEYTAKEMVNTMHSFFTPLSEDKTEWKSEINYSKFNGLMPKLMAYLMPGMFKKQAQKWSDQFKTFAENQ